MGTGLLVERIDWLGYLPPSFVYGPSMEEGSAELWVGFSMEGACIFPTLLTCVCPRITRSNSVQNRPSLFPSLRSTRMIIVAPKDIYPNLMLI